MDIIFQWFSPFIIGLQSFSETVFNYPVLYALILGLISAFAPCQLTSNISLFTLYTSEGLQRGFPIRSLLLFSLGKLTVYVSLVLLILFFGQELQPKLTTLFPYLNIWMGPLWIATGFFLIKPHFLAQSFSHVHRMFLPQHYNGSAFLYGFFIALAFCPTMFSIFFLSFVPYLLNSFSTIVLSFSVVSLPIFFTLGTLLPLLFILSLLFILPERKGIVRSSKKWGNRISKIAGIVLIIIGIQQLLTYL